MGYEWACADGGAVTCRGTISAADEEELRAELLKHLEKKHGVDTPTKTIVDHLVAVAKRT